MGENIFHKSSKVSVFFSVQKKQAALGPAITIIRYYKQAPRLVGAING